MRFDILLALLCLLIGIFISLDKIKEFEKKHWGWRYVKDKKSRECLRVAKNVWKSKNGMVVTWTLSRCFFQHILPKWKKENMSRYPLINVLGFDPLADNGFIKRGPRFELFKKWVQDIPVDPSNKIPEYWSTPEALRNLNECIFFVIETSIDFQGGFALSAFLKSLNPFEVNTAHLLQEQLEKGNFVDCNS